MKFEKILFFSILIIFSFLGNNIKASSCNNHDMHGYAWSDGIGWISFDCNDTNSEIDYGVDVDRDGNLSGEAWSDAIGWISFDYYDNNDRPRYNKNTHKLEGYAKALAGLDNANDKWNGKIALSGTSENGSSFAPEYNKGNLEFDKYAWGGRNLGWIDFKTNYGVVTMDAFYFSFSSNKGTSGEVIDYGDSIILSWITDNAVSCRASDGQDTTWTDVINKAVGSPNSASETIANLTKDTIFSLTCTDSEGTSIKKTLSIKVAPEPPSLFLYVDDDNIGYNTSTPIHWRIKNVKNCVASSSSNTWSGNINSADGEHTDSTGNLTDFSNWFKVSCDSEEEDFYPDGVESLVYVNVEKLLVEFYPDENPVKFNDRIKLFWVTQFAKKCTASGDLTEFNGDKDHSEGIHEFTKTDKETTEGVFYNIILDCDGNEDQHIRKEIYIKVGNNPIYNEL